MRSPCGSGLAREGASPSNLKPSGFIQWHSHTQGRALPRFTLKRQLPAHDQHPLTHADHTEGCRPASGGDKSYAIIADSQTEFIALKGQRQFNSMRLGVAHDIGQRFLKDAEQPDGLGVAEHRQVIRHLHQTRDLRARLEPPRLPLDGRGDPGIENRRP